MEPIQRETFGNRKVINLADRRLYMTYLTDVVLDDTVTK